MKAYVYENYGGPEVVRCVTRPQPVPAAKEVLIEVHAASVSSADWRLRSLTMPQGLGWAGRLMVGIKGPRKPILGTECSGRIVAIGKAVAQFSVGDDVIVFPGAKLGAHATHLVMKEKANIALKPKSLTFEEAAGLSFAGTTAYDYLIRKGKVQEGERVLINGASGTVGLAAVQIAADLGAVVTGICSSGNSELVQSYGAAEVIAYDTSPTSASDGPFEVVVDVVGTLGWLGTKPLLRSGGRMLLIAGTAKDMIFGPLRARRSGHRLISGVAGEDRALFDAVLSMATEGKLRPVIDSTYEFAEMQAAHARVDSGRKRGAVIARMSKED